MVLCMTLQVLDGGASKAIVVDERLQIRVGIVCCKEYDPRSKKLVKVKATEATLQAAGKASCKICKAKLFVMSHAGMLVFEKQPQKPMMYS